MEINSGILDANRFRNENKKSIQFLQQLYPKNKVIFHLGEYT